MQKCPAQKWQHKETFIFHLWCRLTELDSSDVQSENLFILSTPGVTLERFGPLKLCSPTPADRKKTPALFGIPGGSLEKLQHIQNCAARVLMRRRKFDITPVLQPNAIGWWQPPMAHEAGDIISAVSLFHSVFEVNLFTICHQPFSFSRWCSFRSEKSDWVHLWERRSLFWFLLFDFIAFISSFLLNLAQIWEKTARFFWCTCCHGERLNRSPNDGLFYMHGKPN